MDIKSKIRNLPKAIKNIPQTIRDAINGYMESYRNGVEKYGVWWKVFQISMWSFILVFILTAVIILVFFLPQVELIGY